MAITMYEGFEDGYLPPGYAWDIEPVVGNIAFGNDFPAGRSGGLCCRVYAAYSVWKTLTFPVPARSAFALGIAINGDFSATGSTILGLDEGGTRHLSLKVATSGFLTVESNGVVLGTATSTFTTVGGTWNHYEVTAVISDTVGSVKVKVNGVTLINVSGVDTRNGGASGVVNSVTVGRTTVGGSYGNYRGLYVDDIYTTDTSGAAPYNAGLGDCVIESYRPNADGASSQWLGSDGDSLSNWQLVDDQSGTTDYVSTQTVGARDLYNLPDGPTPFGTLLAVQQKVLAAKADAGATPGSLTLESRAPDGTLRSETVANNLTLTTTYARFAGAIQTTDPTGAAWSEAGLNGLQIGYEIT